MLVIRLTRVGKRNSPSYRIVVADKRRAVKRKFIEILGHYNPTLKPKELKIDKDRSIFWMDRGAQPSDTVNNLMCNLGILDKKEKVNKVYGKPLSKKAIKAGPEKSVKPKEEINEEITETEVPEVTAEEKIETDESIESSEALNQEIKNIEKTEPEIKIEAEEKTKVIPDKKMVKEKTKEKS